MKISVAMCTFNGEKFLIEQIDSILNQTKQVDEIIVCDDGSIDKTIELLEAYRITYPSLFKIYYNDQNLRSSKNFEKAISLCSGDIIFLSDQDDIWATNKVAFYAEYFIKNPQIEVLASNGYCIDEHTIVHKKYSIWDAPEFLRQKKIPIDYFQINAIQRNIATGASMAFTKNFIDKTIPFPEFTNFYHDEWIALLASFENKFELLNEKFFYYRIHQKQQIGGVFFDKNEKSKLKLIEIYNFSQIPQSIKLYKTRLKKMVELNQRLMILCLAKKHPVDFKKMILINIQMYKKLKCDFKKGCFLKYFAITIVDLLSRKRQFKRV